mgnify:FL=1
MKVSPSVKRICENCRVIRRHGRVMVICTNRATSSARAESRFQRQQVNKALSHSEQLNPGYAGPGRETGRLGARPA